MITIDMSKDVQECETCIHKDVCKTREYFETLCIHVNHAFKTFVNNTPILDCNGICTAVFKNPTCSKYRSDGNWMRRFVMDDDDKKPVVNNETNVGRNE